MKLVSVDLEDLVLDPRNTRKHSQINQKAIRASLEKFGQQKPIVIGENNVVVAGNGTVLAARELGWQKISAVRTELRNAEAVAYAIADNRTTDLSEWDNGELIAALNSLKEINLLESTGFAEIDLDLLSPKSGITDAENEWQGMPEFVQEDKRPHRQLIVSFACDDDVDRFSKLIDQKITDKTKSIWFPKVLSDKFTDKRYVSES